MDFETVGKFMLAIWVALFLSCLALTGIIGWGIVMLVLHFL